MWSSTIHDLARDTLLTTHCSICIMDALPVTARAAGPCKQKRAFAATVGGAHVQVAVVWGAPQACEVSGGRVEAACQTVVYKTLPALCERG